MRSDRNSLKPVSVPAELPAMLLSDLRYAQRLFGLVADGTSDHADEVELDEMTKKIQAELLELGYDPDEYFRLRREKLGEAKPSKEGERVAS